MGRFCRYAAGGNPKLTTQMGCDKLSLYAGMMELADMQDLGSCALACGFDSHYPYQKKAAQRAAFFNEICLRQVK